MLSSSSSRKDREQHFIKRATQMHGNKYDYSNLGYNKSTEKITIKCKICGTTFSILPYNHLKGHGGCPVCSWERNRTAPQLYLEKANRIHNNKYEYDLTNYKNGKSIISIKCPEHGWFSQRAESHLQGHGCAKCQYEKLHAIHCDTAEAFIEKAKQVHGELYSYEKVEYYNRFKPVIITCPIHGDFNQVPGTHLDGGGCPACHIKGLAKEVYEMLGSRNIEFEIEKGFDWLKGSGGGYMKLDFYLPSKQLAIECHGIEHFRKHHFFHKTEDRYRKRQADDDLKHDLCKEHGIDVIYFAENKEYIDGYRYPVITDFEELFKIITA